MCALRYEVAVDAEFELVPRKRDWKLGDPLEPVELWFQKRRFLWHPGTAETYPIVTTPASTADDWHEVELVTERLLSALSATHLWGLRVSSVGVGKMVPREEFDAPTWTARRPPALHHKVAPELIVPEDDKNRMKCLALLREARNSNSAALSLLTYWKVIEVCVGRNEKKLNDWINKNVRDLEKSWARDAGIPIEDMRRDWFSYFKEARHAAAHAIPRGSKPFMVDPDDPGTRRRLEVDGQKIHTLAVRAVGERWEELVIENDPPNDLLGQDIPWP